MLCGALPLDYQKKWRTTLSLHLLSFLTLAQEVTTVISALLLLKDERTFHFILRAKNILPLAHQSNLNQRNDISVSANAALNFNINSSSNDSLFTVAPSSFVTQVPDVFDVRPPLKQLQINEQWQNRFPNIYGPLNVHPCIPPPGYPPVPPFAWHFAAPSPHFLHLISYRLSPAPIDFMNLVPHWATQAFLSLHFTSLEIIRRLATDDFALDDRMRYLFDLQPRNPDRLSIYQPTASARQFRSDLVDYQCQWYSYCRPAYGPNKCVACATTSGNILYARI